MPRNLPYQLLRFPLLWWRGRMAAIRQEHVFARVLFWTAAALFACCLILASFVLLGDAHPLANDYILHVIASQTAACYSWYENSLWVTISRYPIFTFWGWHVQTVQIPPFLPFYLLLVYVLLKYTGYDGIKGRSLAGVCLIFSVVVLPVGGGIYILVSALVSNEAGAGNVLYAFSPDLLKMQANMSRVLSNHYPTTVSHTLISNCAVNSAAVLLSAGYYLVVALVSVAAAVIFHSKNAVTAYKRIYCSLAMGWFLYPVLIHGADWGVDLYLLGAGESVFDEFLGLIKLK